MTRAPETCTNFDDRANRSKINGGFEKKELVDCKEVVDVYRTRAKRHGNRPSKIYVPQRPIQREKPIRLPFRRGVKQEFEVAHRLFAGVPSCQPVVGAARPAK